MPKILDCFTFYNEIELLTYRLNILNDVVDYFIIVESTHTHVGNVALYSNYNPYLNYYTSPIVNGYINFTTCDTINGKFEGKFEFEAINTTTQEKVKITNGYFRLR